MNRRQFLRVLSAATAAALFAEPLERLGRVYSFPSKIRIHREYPWDIYGLTLYGLNYWQDNPLSAGLITNLAIPRTYKLVRPLVKG